MKLKQHIVVDPPTSDARRERVERKLFEQLAAVRVVERAEAVIPPVKKGRMPMWIGAGALAAAAILAVVLFTRGDTTSPALPSPSRVVTPLGGTTQFTVPGALIEAQSDTSVEVHHGANGAITLEVKRGAIECNVEHRENRPPFKVVAGEVSVEVVGTIFTVTKTPSPRVDVARGKVRVTAPGGQWLIEAGETWPATTQTAVADPVPVPDAPPVAEEPGAEPVAEEPVAEESVDDAHPVAKKKAAAPIAPKEAPKAKTEVITKEEKDLAKESYRIANRLEDTDPAKAAQLYRSIATNGKGMEAVALISLAEVELKLKHPAQALAALDELKQRFPKAAVTEDSAWLRFKALTAMGKRDEARGVKDEYLRQFPSGAYADRLRAN